MQSSASFHSQLCSIMDILSKAAVAEIVKLVDDSCCVLRLEMNHCQNENERLKRKLQMMESELRAARRCESYYAAGHDKLHATETVAGSGTDSGDPSPVEYRQCDEQTDTRAGATEGLEEEEEDQEVTRVASMDRLPCLKRTCEQLADQGRAVKPECKDENSPRTLMVPRHVEGRKKRPDSDYAEHERSGQIWTSFTLDSSDDARDSTAFPCVAGRYSLIHAEPQPNPNPSASEKLHSVSGPWDLMSSMVGIKEEVDVHSIGNEKIASNAAVVPRKQYGEGLLCSSKTEDFAVHPKHQGHTHGAEHLRMDGSPTGPSAVMADRDGCGQSGDSFDAGRGARSHRAGAGKKWFICAHCGKSLAYFSCYKVHLRSHTGEKPYSCLECGKSFTQQSNLTKHESVHSGKKPFSCPQCGKSFRHRYNLTLHQRIHSGEKPFQCAQCGKSFAQSCHFKRHQLCHNGEKHHGYAG